jgi:hypothetical protein
VIFPLFSSITFNRFGWGGELSYNASKVRSELALGFSQPSSSNLANVEIEFGTELGASVRTALDSPQLVNSLYTSELEQQQSSNAGNVYVCFVVDLSMTPFIDQLRKCMDDLALQLTNCNPHKGIGVAVRADWVQGLRGC